MSVCDDKVQGDHKGVLDNLDLICESTKAECEASIGSSEGMKRRRACLHAELIGKVINMCSVGSKL
jgi:hypothetical protein